MKTCQSRDAKQEYTGLQRPPGSYCVGFPSGNHVGLVSRIILLEEPSGMIVWMKGCSRAATDDGRVPSRTLFWASSRPRRVSLLCGPVELSVVEQLCSPISNKLSCVFRHLSIRATDIPLQTGNTPPETWKCSHPALTGPFLLLKLHRWGENLAKCMWRFQVPWWREHQCYSLDLSVVIMPIIMNNLDDLMAIVFFYLSNFYQKRLMDGLTGCLEGSCDAVVFNYQSPWNK